MKRLFGLSLALSALLVSASASPAKPASQRQSGPGQALTYQNAVSFLRSAGFRATEVQKRCSVFFEGEWKSANLYNYCLIIVENSDEDVQVTFYLTDAHEMNWVTEFLDGPFFNRGETEGLFGLMNSGREVRGKKIGRYRVDFHRWEPRHALILVFSFTPKG